MFRLPYEWLIGTRYLRSTHRKGFVSFVAIVSVLGLALGVATLIVVLSVMNGFQREIRSRILSVTSHATLMGLEGDLANWRLIRGAALRQPGVEAAAPYIEEQAMLANGGSIAGATVRGVLPEEEKTATGLAQRVIQGKLDDLRAGEYNTILGSALAKELNVAIGGTVVLIAPDGIATPTGVVPRMRRFRVAGIFESGMYEFDRGTAIVHMTDAARLFRLDDKVTGIRLFLQDPLRAPATVRKVALALGGNFYVRDWTMDHENFFRSIESMKKMMFIILFMIVAVAAFNIVATLVMIVKEKQTDIAILRTLGAGPPNVLLTFAVQGVLIGLAGTVLGAVLGKVLSDHLGGIVGALQRMLDTQFIDARVYYISDLPTYVEGTDVLRICGVAFVLCALATIYPAWRASRTAPAQALRHE
ncbi:MAG TPA: lipoprotein-releasing ABC transporter permease subunit [Steroidobacteraceae bacterium]|nr:lipoprotein-releasing ABC transporter permease subunit [Steroidobacteraceae bacterium]